MSRSISLKVRFEVFKRDGFRWNKVRETEA